MKKHILILLAVLACLMTFSALAETWYCPMCGTRNEYNFCPKDGTKKPDMSSYGSSTATLGLATPTSAPAKIYGLTVQKLFLNDGPGTKRFFNELGSYGAKGERVHLLARAWDPNNGIWWVKVEYPDGTGFTGWTGYKRFDASSFRLDDLPQENWY